jgi:putative membrane protein
MVKDSLFSEFSKQSPKGILVIYAKLLFKAFKATWILLILFIQRFSNLSESALSYIYIGIAVFLIFFLIRAYLIYKNFLFKIADGHFVLKEGILKKTNTSVSFDRVQNINFKQNIIQQLINVYEVSIETAGSKDTEIAIKALTFEKAQALKKELSQVKMTIEFTQNEESNPLLKIDFKELLKVSLTENHLQNLLIFMALVFGALQQLNDVFEGVGKENGLVEYLDVKPEDIFNSIIVVGVLLLVLLAIGVLSSFVRILLFHFNLTLFIKDKSFEITQGLLTKKSIILSRGKVQSITVSTNPIKKILGISFVTFKQAQSGKVKKKQQKLIRIVGCKLAQIQAVKELLYAKQNLANETVFKPNAYYLYRMYFRSFVGVVLLNCILIFVVKDATWLWVNAFIIPLTVLLVQLKFKKTFYQFNENLLLVGNGKVETHATYFPFFKVQNIKLKQTIFQKRRNVLDLVMQTASGKITIPCVENERAVALYNYILYKVESNKESWM